MSRMMELLQLHIDVPLKRATEAYAKRQSAVEGKDVSASEVTRRALRFYLKHHDRAPIRT